jgi:KDO2-lipid IV(A) lauroyltransferase
MSEQEKPDEPETAGAEAGASRPSGLGTPAPHRGPRDPVADRAVHALARLFLLFFRYSPGPLARWVARRMGDLAYLLSARYRSQMVRHMEIAFRGELSREARLRLCRRNFQHLGLFLAEFSRMHWLTRGNVERLVDLSQTRVLDEQLAKGRGLIAVPAHLGNWELCGYAAAVKGYPLKSVARPLDNPLINDMVDQIRQTAGNEILHKWQVLWKLKKLLDKGAIVTMSVDQNGGLGGVFAPLFGVLSSTIPSPAELHLATRAPIIVCTLNRQPDGVRHVFHVWDVIEFEKTGDYEADRLAIVTRINQAYERAVRAYPEQWLWVHKRWKTRPPGEEPGPDGLPPRRQGERQGERRKEKGEGQNGPAP